MDIYSFKIKKDTCRTISDSQGTPLLSACNIYAFDLNKTEFLNYPVFIIIEFIFVMLFQPLCHHYFISDHGI
jgi:hypothetical protein